jgi:hypothetical protein
VIEFQLQFFGRVGEELKSIACSWTTDTLPHPVQEGQTFFLYGEDTDDEVVLEIGDSTLEQRASILTTYIPCGLDAKHCEGGARASQHETEKIRRVLAHNGWSWEASAI